MGSRDATPASGSLRALIVTAIHFKKSGSGSSREKLSGSDF